MLNNPAFYIDMTACSGCKTCMVACMDGHDSPPGVRWRRVTEYTGGSWAAQPGDTYSQNVFSYYTSISCNHCEDPICARSCPTTAMHRNEFGIVRVDETKCVGCRYCEWSCPYSAPQYNAGRGKMSKCDFCFERLQRDETPLCVAACPMRAIKYGEYEEMKKLYGDAVHVAPLPEQRITRPHLVLTPSRHARPTYNREGMLSNPEEV